MPSDSGTSAAVTFDLTNYAWDWGRLLQLEVATALFGIMALMLGLFLRRAARMAARHAAEREQFQRAQQARGDTLDSEITELRIANGALESRLDSERRAHARQLEQLQQQNREQQGRQSESFEALASQVLKRTNQSFLELAKAEFGKLHAQSQGELEKREQAVGSLVRPIRESLERVQGNIQQLELARKQAYGELTEQVKGLLHAQKELKNEADNLVKALRRPEVRGRWGEIQLHKVVEMAGMVDHCDFEEQASTSTDAGTRLRPDLVVHLPGNKNIVVDAKAPLMGYLDAVEAQDEAAHKAALQAHARHIREHIRNLSSKAYWNQFENSPEFVVMFLPGENFFSAALEAEPGLIEQGANSQVILATPTTLIALLRAVAYGWRQEALAEGAKQVSALGREIYARLATLSEHVDKLGNTLGSSVRHYNKMVSSLETRVLVSARKFDSLGVSIEKPLPEQLAGVEESPREIVAPELLPGGDAGRT